jgi:hypothetical protein
LLTLFYVRWETGWVTGSPFPERCQLGAGLTSGANFLLKATTKILPGSGRVLPMDAIAAMASVRRSSGAFGREPISLDSLRFCPGRLQPAQQLGFLGGEFVFGKNAFFEEVGESLDLEKDVVGRRAAGTR